MPRAELANIAAFAKPLEKRCIEVNEVTRNQTPRVLVEIANPVPFSRVLQETLYNMQIGSVKGRHIVAGDYFTDGITVDRDWVMSANRSDRKVLQDIIIKHHEAGLKFNPGAAAQRLSDALDIPIGPPVAGRAPGDQYNHFYINISPTSRVVADRIAAHLNAFLDKKRIPSIRAQHRYRYGGGFGIDLTFDLATHERVLPVFMTNDAKLSPIIVRAYDVALSAECIAAIRAGEPKKPVRKRAKRARRSFLNSLNR